MQIIRIELEGYRRFKLGAFDKLIYEPNSVEQVILGSNGAGKSSILFEIYNIVPKGNDFKVGGRKVHLARHNGMFIRTTSFFKTKAGYFNFETSQDGETWTEHNESGLQSDQHLLVKKFYNLDQDLIDLMTDRIKLTEMDAKERRRWMMRICGTDFSYINKLHDYFKRRHSDYRGTVRVLTESLGSTMKDFESLVQGAADYESETKVLEGIVAVASDGIERIGGDHTDLNRLRAEVGLTANRVDQASRDLLKSFELKRGDFYYRDEKEIIRQAEISTQEKNELHGRRKVLEERLREVQHAINSIGRENLLHPSNIDNQIAEVEQRIMELPKPHNDEINIDAWVAKAKSGEIALGRLQGPLNSFPVGLNRGELKAKYKEAKQTIDKLAPYLQSCSDKFNAANSRLTQCDHTESVECPSCSAKFKPGFNADLIEGIKRAAKHWANEVEQTTLKIAQANLVVQDFESVASLYNEINGIFNDHRECEELWHRVFEEKLLDRNPMSIATCLQEWVSDCHLYVERLRHEETLAKLQNVKAVMKEDKGYLLQTADDLEKDLFETLQQIDACSYRYELAEDALKSFIVFKRQFEKYDQLVKRHRELVDQLYEQTTKQHLQEIRKRSTVRMGVLHQLQEKHRVLAERIEMLKEQLVHAQQEVEVAKLLDKATSATEGVVADVIKEFMEFYLNMYNNNLRKVWSYDLIVTEAKDKGEVFTCSFPVQIADEANAIDDVKYGSTGQISMFNFAYKLVVFKLLGFKDYPLLADEFGKDFDDEHRERLVSFIKDLIEEKDFGQLFMVSHYSSVYSAFDQAEFVVLDDKNIVKPAEYNTGITFE